MNIVFDLDGTLIDSRLRLYRLFQFLALNSTLTYDQYWAFKKNKVSNESILKTELGYGHDQVVKFVENWMDLIESPNYLSLDSNFDGMHKALADLKEIGSLYVCTARQLRQPVQEQLSRLNLLQFFKEVFVTEQKYSKDSLIAANVKNLCSNDWLIGDTGKDIMVGKILGMKTCAVLTGFLNRKSLQGYEPDLIVGSVVDFKKTIL